MKCVICGDEATVAVRGTVAKEYVNTCPFHAGMLQMIFEKVAVSDSVKWRPIFTEGEKNGQ